MTAIQRSARGQRNWFQPDLFLMEKLTADPLPMSSLPTCEALPNVISSSAYSAGPLRLLSLDGLKIAFAGLAPAPVSPLALPVKAKEPPTKGTSGLNSPDSSASASLQSSLASKLHQRMDVNGSLEYSLTWKQWAIDGQEPICALRASRRRTLDSDSSGWPTPDANGMNDGERLESFQARQAVLKAKHGNGNGAGMPIAIAAQLAGWCSPSARDWKDTPGMATTGTNPDGSERTRLDQLPRQAALAGWATPQAFDANDCRRGMEAEAKDRAGRAVDGRNGGPSSNLREQVHGATPDGSNAATESADVFQLNPRFSLWLQGFPTSWHDAGLRAQQSLVAAETASSRKSPPNLSAPTSK
jgi:hypothetical protein